MKTFREFLQEKYGTSGTYAAYRFSEQSKHQISKYMVQNAIENQIDPDKLHVTLLYSRKPMTGYVARGDLQDPIPVMVKGFNVWDTQDGQKALVAQLSAPQVEARHKELMDAFGGTYDFPDYLPHFTLSYDVGPDLIADNLPAFSVPLYLNHEYSEDLDTNWNDKS